MVEKENTFTKDGYEITVVARDTSVGKTRQSGYLVKVEVEDLETGEYEERTQTFTNVKLALNNLVMGKPDSVEGACKYVTQKAIKKLEETDEDQAEKELEQAVNNVEDDL